MITFHHATLHWLNLYMHLLQINPQVTTALGDILLHPLLTTQNAK